MVFDYQLRVTQPDYPFGVGKKLAGGDFHMNDWRERVSYILCTQVGLGSYVLWTSDWTKLYTGQTFTRRKTQDPRPTWIHNMYDTLLRQSSIWKSPWAVTHLRVSYGLRPRAAHTAALRPFVLTLLPLPRMCLLAPDTGVQLRVMEMETRTALWDHTARERPSVLLTH